MKVLVCLAIISCWFGLVVSFALVVPDRESLGLSGAEALLGRSMSTPELYLSVALAAVPWLVTIHFLVRYKRLLGRAQ